MSPRRLRRGKVSFRSHNSCLSLGASPPGRRRACVLFGVSFRGEYSDTAWLAAPPDGVGLAGRVFTTGVTPTNTRSFKSAGPRPPHCPTQAASSTGGKWPARMLRPSTTAGRPAQRPSLSAPYVPTAVWQDGSPQTQAPRRRQSQPWWRHASAVTPAAVAPVPVGGVWRRSHCSPYPAA